MKDEETGSEWSHLLGASMAGPMKDQPLKIIPSVMTNWGAWLKRYPDTTATMIEPTATSFDTQMLKANPDWFGLGLVHSGQQRLWRYDGLAKQPLINEEFAELSLVVFFDVESQTPAAWNRKLNDDTLQFTKTAQGVQDTNTKSTWDLLTGEAIDGPLKGSQLDAVPAIVTFSRPWRRFHKNTTLWRPASD